MFYQYYRFVCWFDDVTAHVILYPRLCNYVMWLFDRLPADKQAWENVYWRSDADSDSEAEQ